MEMSKEDIKVRLINDEEVTVKIKKYLTMPQKQELTKRFTNRLQIRGNDNIWEIDICGLTNAIIEKLWSVEDNVGISLSDVVPESIEPYIGPKVKDFLSMGMGSQTKSTDSLILEKPTI
jgi:hypothetical protein